MAEHCGQKKWDIWFVTVSGIIWGNVNNVVEAGSECSNRSNICNISINSTNIQHKPHRMNILLQ